LKGDLNRLENLLVTYKSYLENMEKLINFLHNDIKKLEKSIGELKDG